MSPPALMFDYAMVGGLALSQLLTLFTTPVIYLYLDGLQNWRERSREAPPTGRPAAAAAIRPLGST
jgi:hypothetical protein